MTIRESEEILDLFLKELRKKLGSHLKEVILFGSRARGDFSPDSDYDCLVVMDDLPPDIENVIDEIAGELLYQHDSLFSIFPILEDTYRRQTYDPFLMNVLQSNHMFLAFLFLPRILIQ